MKHVKVNSKTSERVRTPLIRFIKQYGDGHITQKGIRWLKTTPFDELSYNGNLIHVYLDGKKIVGVLAIANYGLEQALIAVHPDYRQSGIAYDLVTNALKEINRLYVKVANDNIPSLKLCFSLGMHAFDLTKGPTGKPTLILGLGNWNAEEWKNK